MRGLPPEKKAEIMQRLKNGERPYDVEKKCGVSFNTVARLRRLIGDVPAPLGSGRKRKLTAHVLAEAEKRIRKDESWSVVAASYGVSPNTLWNRLTYRTGRPGPKRKLSDGALDQAAERLKRGEAWKKVAAFFNVGKTTLRTHLERRKR
jgi:hypothetical protein